MRHAVTIDEDLGSTPVRNGAVYCSPRCGFKCTFAAHERARKEAEALASRLGNGWQPVVHENCGWYYHATKGIASVYPMTEGSMLTSDYKIINYWATISFEYERPLNTQDAQFEAHSETPEDALGFAVQDARTLIQRLSSALAEISE